MKKVVFRPTRADGRSNQQVIIDHVLDKAPGTTFTYEEFKDLLSDCGIKVTRKFIQQVVILARNRLLHEQKRDLICVRNVGYQVAFARDHKAIAGGRTKKANRQLKKALTTLENVRLEEMTEQERTTHLAQQQVNYTLYHEQRRMMKKAQRHDELIARLCFRVDQLEAKAAAS